MRSGEQKIYIMVFLKCYMQIIELELRLGLFQLCVGDATSM